MGTEEGEEAVVTRMYACGGQGVGRADLHIFSCRTSAFWPREYRDSFSCESCGGFLFLFSFFIKDGGEDSIVIEIYVLLRKIMCFVYMIYCTSILVVKSMA